MMIIRSSTNMSFIIIEKLVISRGRYWNIVNGM